ncbi:hypothetical protein MJO29_004283 [Puccinia striiformis f. sp. tritici]|nr:hypothetical protein MJO29_004283 [Puccinia striiformis f. sp. tritici]
MAHTSQTSYCYHGCDCQTQWGTSQARVALKDEVQAKTSKRNLPVCRGQLVHNLPITLTTSHSSPTKPPWLLGVSKVRSQGSSGAINYNAWSQVSLGNKHCHSLKVEQPTKNDLTESAQATPPTKVVRRPPKVSQTEPQRKSTQSSVATRPLQSSSSQVKSLPDELGSSHGRVGVGKPAASKPAAAADCLVNAEASQQQITDSCSSGKRQVPPFPLNECLINHCLRPIAETLATKCQKKQIATDDSRPKPKKSSSQLPTAIPSNPAVSRDKRRPHMQFARHGLWVNEWVATAGEKVSEFLQLHQYCSSPGVCRTGKINGFMYCWSPGQGAGERCTTNVGTSLFLSSWSTWTSAWPIKPPYPEPFWHKTHNYIIGLLRSALSKQPSDVDEVCLSEVIAKNFLSTWSSTGEAVPWPKPRARKAAQPQNIDLDVI